MDNEQEQSSIDQLNNSVRNAKTWVNRAKKAFKLGTSPTSAIEKTVAKQAVQQIVTHGTRTILLSLGGSSLLLFLIILLLLLPPFGSTDESANVPPVNTEVFSGPIPPPGPASTSIANTAENITRILLANCPRQITLANYTCAKALFRGGILHPDIAYNEIVRSVRNNYWLQCVGFVSAVVGGATGVYFPQVGDARDYARNIPGFTFIPARSGATIVAGDIPIQGDPSQHISIATQVFSNTSFRVDEANFDHAGGVAFWRIKGGEPYFKGWLRKN